MVDWCPICPLTQPFIPTGSVNTGLETIKSRLRLRTAVLLQAKVRDRELYAGSACNDSAAEAAYAAIVALYKKTSPLPVFTFISSKATELKSRLVISVVT